MRDIPDPNRDVARCHVVFFGGRFANVRRPQRVSDLVFFLDLPLLFADRLPVLREGLDRTALLDLLRADLNRKRNARVALSSSNKLRRNATP